MILPYNEYHRGMTREICHAVRDRNISAIMDDSKIAKNFSLEK